MRGETVNRGGKSTGRGEGGPPRRGLGRGRATGKTTQGCPPPQVTRGGPREARDAGRPRPSKRATPRGIASSIPLSRTRPGPPTNRRRKPDTRPQATRGEPPFSLLLHPSDSPWGPTPGVRTPCGQTAHAPRAEPGSRPCPRSAPPAAPRDGAGGRETRQRQGPGGAPPSSPPPLHTGTWGGRAAHTPARTCQRPWRPRAGTPARPGGILPQLGGGRRGPRGSGKDSIGPLRARGPQAPNTASAMLRRHRSRASGGAAAGGSGTPRHPLGSLEKAFSPRACRPHPTGHPSAGPARAQDPATRGRGEGGPGSKRSSTGLGQGGWRCPPSHQGNAGRSRSGPWAKGRPVPPQGRRPFAPQGTGTPRGEAKVK